MAWRLRTLRNYIPKKYVMIALATSAKEARDILNKSYRGADKIKKVKLQSLRRQYELLAMNNQKLVGDYFTRIQVLVNSMKACGEKCYACQKWGHFADECYSNKGKQKNEDEAQMAQDDSDDSDLDLVLLMVTTSDCAKSDFWYLDTQCSNHMTGNKGWFVNLDENVKRMVKFADNSTIIAEGIGKVLIQRRNEQQSLIKDVLYVS
ncbi:hypothetical protein CR513_20828, partial [Mucuna pruriens]